MKSAPVKQRPLYIVLTEWPQPWGLFPWENMSWSRGRPLDTMESLMRLEIGARS